MKFLSFSLLLIITFTVLADMDDLRPEGVSDSKWSSLKAAVQGSTKLLPTPQNIGSAFSKFGQSIAFDGDRVLIGGPKMLDGAGAAILFEFDGNVWNEVSILRSLDGERGDEFGHSVSLSGDRALIGARLDGIAEGSAYVFELIGGTWKQSSKLIASDSDVTDQFGISVSLFDDRALVGAWGNGSGSAYVFDFDKIGGQWLESQKLTGYDTNTNYEFGNSVLLTSDRVFVGAWNDNVQSGAVFVFDLTNEIWLQSQKLIAADYAGRENFGASLSYSNDRLLIGAPYDDDNGIDSGSAFVFEFDINTKEWIQSMKLIADDGTDYDLFGSNVSISGNRAIIGALRDDDNGSSSGSSYIFNLEANSGLWTQGEKLTALDGSAGDQFGTSLVLSGDRAFVGAAYNDVGSYLNSGSVYEFDFDGEWSQRHKLTASIGAAYDGFGWSVSQSVNRVLIGARYDDDFGNGSGSAYIFEKKLDNGSWFLSEKLVPIDGNEGDQFGVSVSLSGDSALIGAWSDDDKGSASGSAYLFEFDVESGSWFQAQKITASDGLAEDQFGWSVSLNNDRALIGAWGDDDNGFDSGSAYVFELDQKSGLWLESQKLLASDDAEGDYFGWSVSLSDDRALVGSYGDNNGNFLESSGSAYLFDLNENSGLWLESQKLTASEANSYDNFGFSVSLLGDRALIGAYNDDENRGSAYLFELNDGSWLESQKLIANDAQAYDQFGYSVSLSDEYILIGANTDNDDAGSAYLFEQNVDDGYWFQSMNITPNDSSYSDQFGFSVNIVDSQVLIGAIRDDDHGTNSGSVYVFNIDNDIVFKNSFEIVTPN